MASRYQATDPEGYERIMGRFSNRLAPSFVTFAGSSAGERVLDVGCGTGQTVAALAAQGNHAAIAAIDVSATYVEYANARSGDPRISFQVADAGDLPFEDDSFDRAVCQLVLQFMPDPSPAVLEMRRVVRPGGVVAACVWDSFGALPPMRVVWDVAVGLGLTEEPRLMRPLGSPGELFTMWSAAGFEEVEEDVLTVRFQYDDFSDFWNSFENGDGPIRQLISALSQTGRETLKKKLEVAFLSGAGDGPRSFLAGALACRGVVPIL